jgi:signal transduction histidine kinase
MIIVALVISKAANLLLNAVTFDKLRVDKLSLRRVSETRYKDCSLPPRRKAKPGACAFRRVDLPRANVKGRRTFEQAIVAAVEREHKRFAGDLHDGVCQELAGVAMMIDAVLPRVASEVATEIRSIAEHIRRVALDARRLALGLAPTAVVRAGLAGALALLKLDMETRGGPTLVVAVEERFSRKLPLDMSVNLYRIAQEATTNAMRHSGASHVYISAEVCDAGLLLAIQDDGCGIRDIGSELWGLGIMSMASRAQSLGGEFSLLPGIPQGTRVQVVVPMDCGKA